MAFAHVLALRPPHYRHLIDEVPIIKRYIEAVEYNFIPVPEAEVRHTLSERALRGRGYGWGGGEVNPWWDRLLGGTESLVGQNSWWGRLLCGIDFLLRYRIFHG